MDLLHRADTAALSAAFLAGIAMDAIAAALRERHVGEGLLILHVVGVDAVADEGHGASGEGQARRRARAQRCRALADRSAANRACDRASGYIDDVVRYAPSIGKSGDVASQHAQALARGGWSRRN